jgi:hypothetical protein
MGIRFVALARRRTLQYMNGRTCARVYRSRQAETKILITGFVPQLRFVPLLL